MAHEQQLLTLTTIPPSPLTTTVPVEIRVGISRGAEVGTGEISLYLDKLSDDSVVGCISFAANGNEAAFVSYRCQLPAGKHTIFADMRMGSSHHSGSIEVEVFASDTRATMLIDGAFCGFYHWSEQEGRLWNAELKKFTASDWRELIRAQHDLGMQVIIPQESFRNPLYVGEHSIETDGYHGLAFYPSSLYPGRMDIACSDPLEAVMAEADELGMQVFLPVGMYAHFDFTPGSLKWHKEVASELFALYGHHESFYGWYVSEEIHGHLGTTIERREELITFFRLFKRHCNQMAPGKPVMLATNCHDVPASREYYERLLPHLDILCPFAFQRMPEGDLTGPEAAALLQDLCDAAGSHLWLDLEAFCFADDVALYPRPVREIAEELALYPDFERVVCYQFPGIFNSPGAARKPGGAATVAMYEEYLKYLGQRRAESNLKSASGELVGQG